MLLEAGLSCFFLITWYLRLYLFHVDKLSAVVGMSKMVCVDLWIF